MCFCLQREQPSERESTMHLALSVWHLKHDWTSQQIILAHF
jgi:hypothetical protein